MKLEPTSQSEFGAYQSDMDQAQSRYLAGINAGYSDEDAKQMYLLPTVQKWDALKALPPDRRMLASQELDDAHISYLNGIQSGHTAKDSENMFLKPVQQKWVGAADFREPDKADPDLSFKHGAISMVLGGLPEADIISLIDENQRNIFGDKKFVADFSDAYKLALKQRQTQQSKAADAKIKADAAAAEIPGKLRNEMIRLSQGAKNFEPDSPGGNILKDRLAEVESQLLSGGAGSPRFEAQPQITDEEMVAGEHPSWTPEQVKLAVAGKLVGAKTSPDVGEVRKGFRFKGGNPADKSNWEPVK